MNVTDGARASVRMSALATVAIMRAEGVDTILQMTVRDRNRIALAADALGAAALGVRGFLALWGDPVKVGENPDAAEVRDLETVELIELLAGIREGRLPGGREVDGPPPTYLVGSAASAGPAPVDGLVAKLDAGADLVQTQIVLDGEGFAEWFGRCRDAGVADRATVLAGIAVPRSGEWIARMEKMGARASAELAERAERGEGAEAVADLIDELVADRRAGGRSPDAARVPARADPRPGSARPPGASARDRRSRRTGLCFGACVGRVGWASPSPCSCAPDAPEPVSRRRRTRRSRQKQLEPIEAATKRLRRRLRPPRRSGPSLRRRRMARPTSWPRSDGRCTRRFGTVAARSQFGQPVWVPVLRHHHRARAAARPARQARPGRRGRPVGLPAPVAEGPGRRRPVVRPDGRRATAIAGWDVPGRQGRAVHAHADRALLRHRPAAVRVRQPVRARSPCGLSAHVSQLPSSWLGGDQVAIHFGAMGAVSHGCIHAQLDAIRMLERRAALGTVVIIRA